MLSGESNHRRELTVRQADGSSRTSTWNITLRPTVVAGRYVYDRVTVASADEPPKDISTSVLANLRIREVTRLDANRRMETLAALAGVSKVSEVRRMAKDELHRARATRHGGYPPDHWREIARLHQGGGTGAVLAYLTEITGRSVSASTTASHVYRARRNVDPSTKKPYLD
jgi:hypothetical protein